MIREFIAAVLLVVVAQATPASPSKPLMLNIRPVIHRSKLLRMGRVDCEFMKEAEARNSPDPPPSLRHPLVVSFVIGYDGSVYSPFVLESSPSDNADDIIRLVQSWKYYPATCNYASESTEALVVFVP